jgi:ATP-dependent Lon protease
VLIPEDNAKDLADIPDNVKNNMEIIPVSRMGEVLQHALVRQPVAIEWDESFDTATAKAAAAAVDDAGLSVAH